MGTKTVSGEVRIQAVLKIPPHESYAYGPGHTEGLLLAVVSEALHNMSNVNPTQVVLEVLSASFVTPDDIQEAE